MKLHLGDDYLLTEQEAADLLHVSKSTIARKRGARELQVGYLGKSPRYTVGMLRAYMRKTATAKRTTVPLHRR